MGGGLLQLVAYGAQDVYLTGNPQITFFKVVYRRHTNFSIESIQQSINGKFDFGNRVTCQISRNGDLIHRMMLEVELNQLDDEPITPFLTSSHRYVNYIGHRLIKSMELEIGGQKIDKQYSHWMYIWNELSLPIEKEIGYKSMIGADSDDTSFKNNKIYIPFEFWFCRNIGLALPLIALQYHEVKVNIEIESFNNCCYEGASGTTVGNIPYGQTTSLISPSSTKKSNKIKNASLWCDYIFLDTDERRRFAQLSHEYLIEQIQFNEHSITVANKEQSVNIVMNHPVKELIWTVNPDDGRKNNQWYNYTDIDYDSSNNEYTFLTDPEGNNLIESAVLQLNGNERFAKRDGKYFSHVQTYQHHTNVPQNNGINVYSFALKPEDHQPSGTLNFSRIDSAKLVIKSKNTGKLNVWGVNYNVLRILSGMGGLAYSN